MVFKKPEFLQPLRNFYQSNEIPVKEANIFGVRFPEDQNKDVWNDILGIWTAHNVYCWQGTTDPGKHATENKENGAAHLCVGYHSNIWQAGIHAKSNPRFAHPALVQTGNKVKIWRDVDKDYINDDNAYEEGYFGINFHRASIVSNVPNIGRYGAGCQVTLDAKDFEFALNLLLNTQKFIENNKMRFSYMLFDKEMINIRI